MFVRSTRLCAQSKSALFLMLCCVLCVGVAVTSAGFARAKQAPNASNSAQPRYVVTLSNLVNTDEHYKGIMIERKPYQKDRNFFEYTIATLYRHPKESAKNIPCTDKVRCQPIVSFTIQHQKYVYPTSFPAYYASEKCSRPVINYTAKNLMEKFIEQSKIPLLIELLKNKPCVSFYTIVVHKKMTVAVAPRMTFTKLYTLLQGGK